MACFGFEIGSGFGEAGGTPLRQIPDSTPPPPEILVSSSCFAAVVVVVRQLGT